MFEFLIIQKLESDVKQLREEHERLRLAYIELSKKVDVLITTQYGPGVTITFPEDK